MEIVDLEEQCNYLLGEIEKNCRKAAMIRSQIERLKMQSKSNNKPSKITIQSFEEREESQEEINPFEDEVDYYLEDYRNLEEDFTEEDLFSILPSEKNYNFKSIILRLQAESIREMKDLNELIQEISNPTQEELEDYRKLLIQEQRKISILKEVLRKPEKLIETQKEKNRLVLVPSEAGNITALSEITSDIPKEYYSNFKELFDSIIDGTFKGVKRFSNNSNLTGISEVKAFKIRIAFTRLNKNTYAIISVFMKKFTNDKHYQETLSKKVKNYRRIESYLKQQAGNEEFMEENEKNVEELFRILSKEENNTNKRGNVL